MPGGAEAALVPHARSRRRLHLRHRAPRNRIQTKDQKYLEIYRLTSADRQWENPLPDGLSHETRYWIDDMYMLTILQLEAYRATGDKKYLDRGASEMAAYLDKLQQPNGLFYHAPDVPFFWGRGDGWVAAGMTEMLRAAEEPSPARAHHGGLRKMMMALLQYQGKDGMWRQLIDHPKPGLKLLRPRCSPSRINEFPDRRTHRHLVHTGSIHGTAQGEHHRAGALFCADLGEPSHAFQKNPWNIAQSFDIVDQRWLPVEAEVRRVKRRLLSRHRRAPLHGFEHRCFLTGHVTPVTFENLQIEIHATPQNILAQKPLRLRLRQRLFQILAFFMILMIHIDKCSLRLHRVGPNEATFDELVGCMLKQVPVFKCSWLMFTGITDEIVLLHPMVENLFPLDAGGKACTSSPTEPGFLQLIDDIVRAQLFETFLPGLVTPDLPVGFDIPGSAIKRLENSWFIAAVMRPSIPIYSESGTVL